MARRHRKSRAPTREQLQERFSTDGQDFFQALRRIVAGGRSEDTDAATDQEAVMTFTEPDYDVNKDTELQEYSRRLWADPEYRAKADKLRQEALAELEARRAQEA